MKGFRLIGVVLCATVLAALEVPVAPLFWGMLIVAGLGCLILDTMELKPDALNPDRS